MAGKCLGETHNSWDCCQFVVVLAYWSAMSAVEQWRAEGAECKLW
jgi:hypothetical protein